MLHFHSSNTTLLRMSWFCTLILLTFALLSEAKHHANKLPSAAAVVGTVYCDTCFHQDLPKPDHFIAGATVAVECKSSSSRPPFRQEVKTNSRGEFRVDLPFSVGKHVNTIRACSVALIRSSDRSCAAAAASSSSPLRLKSRNGREQIFSAGLFAFKPQVCNQKQSAAAGSSKHGSPEKFFILPPNPLNPGLLPPNPLLPPPSLIPPVLPTPPPSLIPPVLPTPPSSSPSLPLPLPPIPGLPPSPLPPPPALPVPLPPLPLPPVPLPPLPLPPVPLPPLPLPPVPLPPLPLPPVPVLPPGIPGVPPAEVSSPVKTSQP